MPDRTAYLAANWKMHKTTEETENFLAEFLPRVPESGGPEVVICPPFTSLKTAVEHCFQSRVRVAAQNMHEADEGAFTGEISAPMLLDLGVEGVILGHSERRQYFNETDEALARKVPAALGAGLEPILCVGENEAQRDADETEEVLTRQVRADLAEVPGRAAQRGGDRLRADLGDRHRPHRHPRAGAGGDRADPRSDRGALATRRPRRSGSSTAARSSPTTPRS